MPERNQIFVSYSHKDRKLFEEFKAMLAPAIRNGKLDLWSDTKIAVGEEWKKQIQQALNCASVAVLLVSPNFLDSSFIVEHELQPLLNAARDGGVRIFWVYLSSSLYEDAGLGKYQAAHDLSAPLDTLSRAQRQRVLKSIAERLIDAQSRILQQPSDNGTASVAPAGDPRAEDHLKCSLLIWEAVDTAFYASHGGGPTTALHRKMEVAKKWLNDGKQLLPSCSNRVPVELLQALKGAEKTVLRLLSEARLVLPSPGETGDRKDNDFYLEARDTTYFLMTRLQTALKQDSAFSALESSGEKWPILGFRDEAEFKDYLYPSIRSLAKSPDSMQRDLLQNMLGLQRFSIGGLRRQGYTPAVIMDSVNALLTETWARWLGPAGEENTEIELTVVGSRLLKQLVS